MAINAHIDGPTEEPNHEKPFQPDIGPHFVAEIENLTANYN